MFNWGVLFGWVVVYGLCDWGAVLSFYVLGVAWILVYDIIYAY